MSKKIYDPALGEMIGIAEVEKQTGITKATLRNWRKAEHAHLAKFIGYQIMGTRDVMYRQADIDLWLSQNNIIKGNTTFQALEAPNALSAPLNDVVADGKKAELLQDLAQITSENAYFVWFDKFSKLDYKRLVDKLKDRSAHYKAKVLGGQPEEIGRAHV